MDFYKEVWDVKVADIVYESVVDGEGVRNVLFVQGCRHNCRGCHNPSTHDFNGGKSIDENVIAETLAKGWTGDDKLRITVSGGDPFYQPTSLAELCAIMKNRYHANIWVYTGFRWEEIRSRYRVLSNVDVVVDGPFILGRKTLEIPYVGSDNQRIIDVRKSLHNGNVVLWHDSEVPDMDLIRRVLE